jgi:hypothetical protein
MHEGAINIPFCLFRMRKNLNFYPKEKKECSGQGFLPMLMPDVTMVSFTSTSSTATAAILMVRNMIGELLSKLLDGVSNATRRE